MQSAGRRRLLAALALSVTVTASCSADDGAIQTSAVSAEEGSSDYVPYAASQMNTVAAQAASLEAMSVAELLPNAFLEVQPDEYRSFTDTVVIGTPVEVIPDRAVVWEMTADGDIERQVDFEGTQSAMRFWTVRIEIDEVLAGGAPSEVLPGAADDVIEVPVASAGGRADLNQFQQGLLGFGRSVWFLRAAQRSEGASQDEFRVGWNGGGIAIVAEDGSLTFPTVADDFKEATKGFTLDELRELAARPPYQVDRGMGGR